ncbi:MAG: hypothetical protein C4B59_14055 [Candidatus Methanogaster sp.]|uniref:Uncharacterized protein n=1 Tax=Candidatus Methanogaster sp. TaxID=3386292 RepID=A0AC61KZW0_9EURY|nr:MAG: hypothetical protein C4B59_14055 [ANME-2 cluster archaeon]
MVRAASAYAHVLEVTADYVNISRFNMIVATGVEKVGIYLDFQTCTEKHHQSIQSLYDLSKHKPACHRFL